MKSEDIEGDTMAISFRDASHALDDQASVHGAAEPMRGHLAIGRAVVPGAGLFDRRELGHDDPLDLRAFERHMSPIGRQHLATSADLETSPGTAIARPPEAVIAATTASAPPRSEA